MEYQVAFQVKSQAKKFQLNWAPAAQAERGLGVNRRQTPESARAEAETGFLHRVQKFQHGTGAAFPFTSGEIRGLRHNGFLGLSLSDSILQGVSRLVCQL